jgi:hypothetical protein
MWFAIFRFRAPERCNTGSSQFDPTLHGEKEDFYEPWTTGQRH